jgi:hypothetical protein
MLRSIAEVQDKIASGKPLLLAGSEVALAQLQPGNWIGGTIPYFMDVSGGACDESRVFVTEIPSYATGAQVLEYTVDSVPSICKDAPENGFSVLIMPAGSAIHGAYAREAPGYDGMYLKPLVGWISGVHLSQLGQGQAMVFNGTTGRGLADRAVAMHVSLPADKLAELDIVNVFKPGPGAAITFPVSGFTVGDCFVDGKPDNLARYIAETRSDPSLPLTADYSGSIVNVSVQSVDASSATVKLYSPVFEGVQYKFAGPVDDYVAAFNRIAALHGDVPPTFACNCILNYIYANLEGKHTGSITGPITFGEIAYQLLNQTLVQLRIHDVAAA